MIDAETQQNLRERFNPDGSILRRHQLRMLEMLKYIDKICTENDIPYWLSSGTCLGAVRHGGFIPWDDDVDIEMMAKDYKKLRKCIIEDPNCPYYWQDYTTDINYLYGYAKVRDKHSEIIEFCEENLKYKYKGIFIDVFIITPSNSLFLRKTGAWFVYRYKKQVSKLKSGWLKNFFKNLLYRILIPFMESFQKILAKGRMRHLTGSYFFKPRIMGDIKGIKYIKFEDTNLPVPGNVEDYLTKIYGDYNTLPDSPIVKHTATCKIFE